MDIQNPFRPLRGKRRAEDGEEARQNDKVDLMRGQLFGEPDLKGFLTAAGFPGNRAGRNAGLRRPFQRISPRIG